MRTRAIEFRLTRCEAESQLRMIYIAGPYHTIFQRHEALQLFGPVQHNVRLTFSGNIGVFELKSSCSVLPAEFLHSNDWAQTPALIAQLSNDT